MWIQHPLTRFQRYSQGIAILAKYATGANFGTDRHKGENFVALQIVPSLPVQQDLDLLTYLGWTLTQTLTPYADEQYRNHLELWFYFNEGKQLWKEE